MPLDYDAYSIQRSRARRVQSANQRSLDWQLSVISAGVIVFAVACAIYGALWG